MLTKMQNPNVNYISRVLVLPLLTFVFFAFTIKTKTPSVQNEANIKLEKPFVVVIDAGHGGKDPGSNGENGVTEKALALSIAKKIKQLNSNKDIQILLSRDADVFQPVQDKVKWTMEQKPDAFVSIHINATPEQKTEKSGFDIYISKNENASDKESRLLGSYIATEIAKTYSISPDLKQRTEKGIWVLDAPEISYPALLVQCGYITNKKDLAFISNENNQEKIATDILNALSKYAKAKNEKVTTIVSTEIPQSPFYEETNNIDQVLNIQHRDTLPKKIKSVDVTKEDKVIVIYTDGKAEKMSKTAAEAKGIVLPPQAPEKNGKEVITVKEVTMNDLKETYKKVEIEATFPGGEGAWTKYISETINKNIDTLATAKKTGTCVVEFIVDKNGDISDVKALTLKDTKFSEVVVDAIANGPKWVPAMQDGQKVRAYRKQPVTFVIAND